MWQAQADSLRACLVNVTTLGEKAVMVMLKSDVSEESFWKNWLVNESKKGRNCFSLCSVIWLNCASGFHWA